MARGGVRTCESVPEAKLAVAALAAVSACCNTSELVTAHLLEQPKFIELLHSLPQPPFVGRKELLLLLHNASTCKHTRKQVARLVLKCLPPATTSPKIAVAASG